jgi:aconitate hydratase
MGILPLQYLPGESRESLGLSGREEFAVTGVQNGEARQVTVSAGAGSSAPSFASIRRASVVRLPRRILPYVLRRLLAT